MQLESHRSHASELGFEHAVESRQLADVSELGHLEAESFDAVVSFGGPLSYVFERAPAALAGLTRAARPGGAVLISVMSLWGTSHRYLAGVLEIPAEANARISSTGDLTPRNWNGVNHRCHMFQSGELRKLAADAGLDVVAMSASGCLALTWDEHLAELAPDSPAWQELLRMELEASAKHGCLDMGTHLILVGQKQAGSVAPDSATSRLG